LGATYVKFRTWGGCNMVRFLYVCQNKLKVKTFKQICTAVLLRLLVLASITMMREKEKVVVMKKVMSMMLKR
jgi:hypothetical protein